MAHKSAPTTFCTTLQKRINATYVGSGRLIGSDVSVKVYPEEVNVAFSTDKGITWSVDKKADGLLFNVAKPVYMGNNNILMQSFFLRDQIPCSVGSTQLCDHHGAALYSSSDGGSSWRQLLDLGNSGLYEITYLGKTKLVEGILKPDILGTDTLIAHTYELTAMREYRPKLVRSMDGGATWEETGFPEEMRFYGAPQYNDLWYLAYVGNSTLLAYFHNGDYSGKQYLYKSIDNGATWAAAGKLPNEVVDPGLFGLIFVGDAKTIPED